PLAAPSVRIDTTIGSPTAKVVVGLAMLRSAPASVPGVTEVTSTACGAVSAGALVASGRVPGASIGEAGAEAAGGSSPASVRSASRLQPLRAIVASAAATARWVGLKVMRVLLEIELGQRSGLICGIFNTWPGWIRS